jgi:hypothetical protein
MIRHALVILAILLSPMALHAEEAPDKSAEKSRLSLGGGIGFASSIYDTSAFLMQFDMNYRVWDNVHLGPMLHVAPQDGGSMVSMSLDSKYVFDLSKQADDSLSMLAPYFGVGFGFAHLTAGPGDTSFLLSLITGFEVNVTDQIALTSDMRFNFPVSFDDTFYFTWQVIGARFRF